MTLKLPVRGIYYMLEPMLIMLMVLAIFAVPVLQQDRVDNSRLLELHANDVMSVIFQSGLADRMVQNCTEKGKIDAYTLQQMDEMVRTLSPAYQWRMLLDTRPVCEEGRVWGTQGKQVLVNRTVILPITDIDNVGTADLYLLILLPPPYTI